MIFYLTVCDRMSITYTPKRTQYAFNYPTTNLSIAKITILKNQWNLFETVENYNDIVVQRWANNETNLSFYTFTSLREFEDYLTGWRLHTESYPSIVFTPVRDMPLPIQTPEPKTFVPRRTQYPFNISMQYKSLTDRIKLEMQWNTYEQIENEDDVTYQRIQYGYREKMFHQFRDAEEFKNYRAGQELHANQYPFIRFTTVRDRTFPTAPAKTQVTEYTQVRRDIRPTVPLRSEEYAQQQSENNVYVYVSTYNQSHVYKYNFVSDEERMMYYRAEKRIRGLI